VTSTETASAALGELVSIPALLARNAKRYGMQAAYREKEFGIWQSWTWAETQAEVRAMALGFLALGMREGDYVAIIGRNRPALYWSMVAAQSVGAIPVPLYQDAVAEEMAYVLDHCGARFVICGDQEQVDKVLEVQEKVTCIEEIAYLDKRGMRKYDHSHMNWLEDVMREGRAGGNPSGRGTRPADRISDARSYLCHALYFGDDGQAQGRGAVEPQYHPDLEEFVRV